MSDLSEKEQRNVRTALRFLRVRVGTWAALSAALDLRPDTLERIASARGRSVTASLAMRVARLVDVSIDDLIAGRWLSPRVCPHCGQPPDDFADEETIADDGTRTPGILKLVR